MKTSFNFAEDQITLKKQIWYHFYPGIILTLAYIFISQYIVDLGLPGLTSLLIVELLILPPIELGHMAYHGKKLTGKWSFKNVIGFTEKLSVKQYLKWSLIGILGCFLLAIPLYPVGLFFRETVFSWLPAWYFDPGFGTENMELVAKVFFIGIFVDGIIGPLVEELFFRGYLLPRMVYLKKWAPVLSGLMFGLYHFWQPHNYFATVAVGILISYIVWKKENVYLGIIIHCTLNILGALGGFLAASQGIAIVR